MKSFLFKRYYQIDEKPGTDWEEMFAKHISDKKLISRRYKELLQLNSTKTKKPGSKKWAK